MGIQSVFHIGVQAIAQRFRQSQRAKSFLQRDKTSLRAPQWIGLEALESRVLLSTAVQDAGNPDGQNIPVISAASIPAGAVSIQSGQTELGTITSVAQTDAYSFQAKLGGNIVVSMGNDRVVGGVVQSQVQLLDSSGNVLDTALAPANSGNVSGGIATLTFVAPTTGLYYIVASSANGITGNYNIAVASMPASPFVDSDGGPIASGQTVVGNIGGELDEYSFQATLGGSIVVSMGNDRVVGGVIQSRVQLFDDSGHLLDAALAPADSGNVSGGIATLTFVAPTTGTYYLVATSANDTTGSYNIAVASMPAAPFVDSDGGPIASGQTVVGNIGGELDEYSFQATLGGSIVVSMGNDRVVGGVVQSRVQLFDDSGHLLDAALAPADSGNVSGGIATLTFVAPTTGTYYLVATSANDTTGSYNIAVASMPAAPFVDSDGGPIASGQTVVGNIGGELDEYSIQATLGGSIVVSMGNNRVVGGVVQSQVQLFDDAGHLLGIALAPADSGNVSGGIATLTCVAPTTGTYYIVATSANDTTGSYNIAVASMPEDPFVDADGGPILSGKTVVGNIGGELDEYSIQATLGGSIVVSMGNNRVVGGVVQSRVQVFDDSGHLLGTALAPADSGNVSGGIATLTVTTPTTGKYYIVASSANDTTGSYNLSVASLPGDQFVDSDGGPIPIGQAVGGTIGGELDAYSFQAALGGSIVISMGNDRVVGGVMQSRVQLFDGSGNLLGTATAPADSGNVSGGNATLTVTAPTTGTYYAVASSANDTTGSYNITVTLGPSYQVASPSVPHDFLQTIASGQTVTNTIPSGGHYHLYSFPAIAGGVIIGSMADTNNIAGFNPSLWLYGPDGTPLTNTTGANAAKLFYLSTQSGTYFLLAGDDNGDTGGTYSLSVVSAGEPQIPGNRGGPIVSGQIKSGVLPVGALDVFTFNAIAGVGVVASMGDVNAVNLFEPRLLLYGPDGSFVASSTANSNGTAISLTTPLSGTYYLVAEDQEGDMGGNYNLALMVGGETQNTGRAADRSPVAKPRRHRCRLAS